MNAQDKVIAEGISTGVYWAARVGESSMRVVTNGQLLLTVSGSQELWRTELPRIGSTQIGSESYWDAGVAPDPFSARNTIPLHC